MLLCAIGLPGIGKTTLLRNAELRGQFAVRELDDWIEPTIPIDLTTGGPRKSHLWMTQECSPEVYVVRQTERGRKLAHEWLDALRQMSSAGEYVLELTTFVWLGLAQVFMKSDIRPPVVYRLCVSQHVHTTRLARRFRVPAEVVKPLAAWLQAADDLVTIAAPLFRIDVQSERDVLMRQLAERAMWTNNAKPGGRCGA